MMAPVDVDVDEEEEERLPMLLGRQRRRRWKAATAAGTRGRCDVGVHDDGYVDVDPDEDDDDRGGGEDDDRGGGEGDGVYYTDHQGERRCRRADAVKRTPPGSTVVVTDAPTTIMATTTTPGASSASDDPHPHQPPTTTSTNRDKDVVHTYLHQFKVRAIECISNAYDRSNCVQRTRSNGALGTSLPEDVIFLFETQLSVLQEYLRRKQQSSSPTPSVSLWDTDQGQEYYHDAVLSILECLIHTQKCTANPVFLSTLEGCCESANDFVRLSELMERLLLTHQYPDIVEPTNSRSDGGGGSTTARTNVAVASKWNEYVSLLSQHAVAAAERTHVLVVRNMVAWHRQTPHRPDHQQHMNPLRRNGHNHSKTHPGRRSPMPPPPAPLFSYQWEVECTHNEIIVGLLQDVCERQHWSKLVRYLEHDVLRNKALLATCKAIVCYYVRCLVERADAAVRARQSLNNHHPHNALRKLGGGRTTYGYSRHRRHRRWPADNGHGGFLHIGRALRRMKDDVALIKEYFVGKASGNPTLTRIVSNEVYILELIHECLEAASAGGAGDNDADDDNSSRSSRDEDLFLDSFILVIHKRTGGDALVTRHFVGDLFLLVNHQERPFQLTVLQQDLHLVTKRMEEVRVGGGNGGDSNHPHNAAKKNDKAELSLVSVDQMLRAMYEDRIVHGMLPLCWTCLPKVDGDDTGGMELVSAKIRELTRGVADLRLKRKAFVP